MANKNTNIPSVITDPQYHAWVNELSQRYHQSQIRAAIGINSEQLRFYWSLGRDIVSMHVEELWGQGVLKQLSTDLTRTLDRKGFSVTSLGYMKRFYLLYPEAQTNLPPLEGKMQTATIQATLANMPPYGGEAASSLLPYLGATIKPSSTRLMAISRKPYSSSTKASRTNGDELCSKTCSRPTSTKSKDSRQTTSS